MYSYYWHFSSKGYGGFRPRNAKVPARRVFWPTWLINVFTDDCVRLAPPLRPRSPPHTHTHTIDCRARYDRRLRPYVAFDVENAIRRAAKRRVSFSKGHGSPTYSAPTTRPNPTARTERPNGRVTSTCVASSATTGAGRRLPEARGESRGSHGVVRDRADGGYVRVQQRERIITTTDSFFFFLYILRVCYYVTDGTWVRIARSKPVIPTRPRGYRLSSETGRVDFIQRWNAFVYKLFSVRIHRVCVKTLLRIRRRGEDGVFPSLSTSVSVNVSVFFPRSFRRF